MPVSTITRPVTQLALVAVNREGMKPVAVPSAEETGSISRSAPAMMTRKKPRAMVCTDVSCLCFILTRAVSPTRRLDDVRPFGLRPVLNGCAVLPRKGRGKGPESGIIADSRLLDYGCKRRALARRWSGAAGFAG